MAAVVIHGEELRVEVVGRLARFILYLATEPELAEDMERAASGKLVASWSGGQMKAWLEKYYARREGESRV